MSTLQAVVIRNSHKWVTFAHKRIMFGQVIEVRTITLQNYVCRFESLRFAWQLMLQIWMPLWREKREVYRNQTAKIKKQKLTLSVKQMFD